MPKSNIVLFGESGAGKSSIVNMLSENEKVAAISSGARGCTFESRDFDVVVLGQHVTLWDTAGLDEGDAARVPKTEAIINLYKLLRNLSDGVSLLVFVMRAPRIKGSVPQNWKLFHEIICQHQVPIVIIITGLEHEEDMDKWWWENKGTFQEYKIIPTGFACITASRGKLKKGGTHFFDDEYEQSQDKVRRLIRSHSLVIPWHVPSAKWFKTIVNITYSYETGMCFTIKRIEHEEMQRVAGDALRELVNTCGMSESEAHELAEKLEDM